ncbi:MAG: HAD-IIIA family hydrolase [Planctomycetes bacterium]|nr:HAD-IIIA family hydrolase [Planctomycetota bacterium]MCK5579472.1 HAD-IIIA family hydrolase [Planctomycetota bacterium]
MSLKQIKMMIMDVDGVLTNGQIALDDRGIEIKMFYVHDGSGIKYLQRVGLKTAIITARRSRAVTHRARDLGIKDVYQNYKNKVPALRKLLKKYRLKSREVCYLGDDLPDIPVMKLVGYPVAVRNARPEVKKCARYITRRNGGDGAVREMVEKILRAQRKWKLILHRYEKI